MTRREEIIVQLLERYDELVHPMQARDGHGEGEAIPLMPSTYTPTLREIERLLQRMRNERPSQWWHLNECYQKCEFVSRKGLLLRGKWVNVATNERVASHPRGWDFEVMRKQSYRQTPLEVPVVIARWNTKVRLEKVRRGVSWIADEWSLEIEPMIPRELLAAA